MTQELQFAIPTLFGLEGLAAEEMRRLGIANVRGDTGRVFGSGTMADIPRLNLNLRTGERVLVVVGTFMATTFDELFEGTKALPWADFIPKNGAFPVKGHSLNSQLHAVSTCQAMIKKAVATTLGTTYGVAQLPENGALYQIQFSILKDCVTVMVDTSGTPLHKRGYRPEGVVAPLRETLAAGLVMVSRYRGKGNFCDPFCGSGTLAIEAALIAQNRAPGLDRSFSAQKWGWLDTNLWLSAADEAMDKEYHGDYEIWGGDLDPEAVAMAGRNAARAGVDDVCKFSVADATQFHHRAPVGGGRIVTNPPYGERIMEKKEAEGLYRSFGASYRQLSDRWELYLLSSHTELERTFGSTAQRRRKLYNGMIKCDLFMYGQDGKK